MMSEPGRGRGRDDDDLTGEPPAFSDEGMRRIIYGDDHRMVSDALGGRAPDARSQLFAEDTAELAERLRGRRNLVPIVTALAAVVCFAAIVWYAYSWGTGQVDSDELPVVIAEPMPEKVKPEQPGGIEVPHQGIAVLNGGNETPQTVERLLPRPEVPAPPEPLPPPAVAEAPPEAPAAPPPADAPFGADGSDADVTEAPLFIQPEVAQPELAEPQIAEPQIAEPVEEPIARPQPKPDDQIAKLLEQEAPETGAGATPAVPAAPATPVQVAKAAPGDIVLQLSSVKSEAAAAAEWKRLQSEHPGLLGKLGLSLETAAVQGTTYWRVQTGPFASRDAATELCAKLKSRNQDCLVKQR